MLREVTLERLSSAFPSCVTIDCDALASNVRRIKALIGADTQLMAVVKADAYGHGASTVAEVALRHGADMLAVANISEAIELRDAGIEAPILVLSWVPAESIHFALALNLSVTVHDLAQAAQLQGCADDVLGRLAVHVKIDSGMGRLGVAYEGAAELCQYICEQTALELEGVYTHFSVADSDLAYTSTQLSRFKSVLGQLNRAGIHPRYAHAANSAALLACRDSHFNLVRPGLLLYGLNPMSGASAVSGLEPVLSWRTSIAQVKSLPAGSTVGYGNTYCTRGRETIAVLPVGYADGLRRSPQTWREVLVRGVRAPLVGRVSMEKVTVNVSHIKDAQAGDEVVLLGRQGAEEISADEVAEWIGSINYEVVTSIAPRVPRTQLYS